MVNKSFKLSHYTFLIEIEKYAEYLVYNSRTGGLLVINSEFGDKMKELEQLSAFDTDGLQQYEAELASLINGGFIVSAERNEVEEIHGDYLTRIDDLTASAQSDIGITIGTTITCNMGCPYCFEFNKPNKTLTSEKVIDALETYIKDIISHNPGKVWRNMTITWYGGEPLINPKAISILSPRLQELCAQHGIRYKADIVTNGILLTTENWNLLNENNVKHVQVTIDGDKETHDKMRPLKNKSARNYELILENLANMPEGMSLTIRVNTDKKVAERIPFLLEDLRTHGLWPQRHKSVSIAPSQLRNYEEASVEGIDYFSNQEFSDEYMRIRELKLNIYNEWAKENSLRPAKLNWILPELQIRECATWASPYHIVVDPDGNIHKCWETIHDSKNGTVSTVFDAFNPNVYDKYTQYDRTQVHEECYTCKFLPICDKLKCAHDAMSHAKPNCTVWKTEINSLLGGQYVRFKENPDMIASPVGKLQDGEVSHANK